MHFTTLAAGADFTRLPYSKLSQQAIVASHWKAYLDYHIALQEFIRRKAEGEDLSAAFGLVDILMTVGYGLRATDHRDKVFGLYGICKRLGYELPRPDYSKDAAQVFKEAALAIAKYDSKLDFLSDMCNPWDHDTLSSWAPNLGPCSRDVTPANPPWLSVAPETPDTMHGLSSSPWDFHISEEDLPTPRGAILTTTILRVLGRHVDVVAAVGEPWKVDFTRTMLGEQPDLTAPIQVGSLVDCVDSWLQIARAAIDSSQPRLT
ncbi:uncharacterized protein B0I36DRAFT_331784, partial [Microdochium trichocladiopsis]